MAPPGSRPAPPALRVLAWIVLALVVGPIGTAAFVLGFVYGESPCVLCWAQRTGMVLVALTGLFILRFGPRPRYVGVAILLGVHGVYMALRHSALHLARDVGQGFSAEILGAHTNTWSLLIFWTTLGVIGLLLLWLSDGEVTRMVRVFSRFETAVAWMFLLAVAGNALQAFASTGPPPYIGQSDPVRFSFNPRHWVWSLDEWGPAPFGVRGRWAIPRPTTAGLVADPAAGPLLGLPTIPAGAILPAPAGIDAPVTGLAHDAAGDRFLVTTRHGVYVTDGGYTHVQRQVTVDPDFSVDLSRFAGALFLDRRTVLALSENKSYVILRENDRADPDAAWRFFLVPGPFDEVTRGRFATVRARMNFVQSAAFDPVAQLVYTIAVPNPRAPRLVVSAFDRGDLTLAREFLPALDPQSGLELGPRRSLDELYVTGATVHGGRLLTLSAAFSTLLSIDVSTGRIVEARALEGIASPAGIAVRAGRLHVALDDGRMVTLPLGLTKETKTTEGTGTTTETNTGGA